MKIRGYRITIAGKIIILQFLITLIGVLCGFTWKTYSESKRWEKLIYPGIKVCGLDLSGRTLEEGKKVVKSQYIDNILKKKIRIVAKGKAYVLENSKLISRVDIDSAVEKAYNFGKSLDEYKKNKLIKEGAQLQYSAALTYNENYIKEIAATIEKDINKGPTNASVNKTSDGNMEIARDIKGCKLQEEKFEELIKAGALSCDKEIEAPIEEVKAEITAEKLSAVDTKIAAFNTSFASSSSARVKNIELSTSLINGRLLMPNDTFSFNDIVGERTEERGFMKAPVIVGDKVEFGLGGGICQVSSTLYNAILRTGIKPSERAHHTLPSSYVELGLDATVDWNDIDFKFKNTLDYPIYIEGYTENRNLYINIYSNSELTSKKYSITNDVYETIQPATKVIDDPNLLQGQVSIEQKGIDGHKVRIRRDTYENGVVINSETISDDFYEPVSSIIRRGIKADK